MKPPTKCGRVHFEHSHRKCLVITVRPTTFVRKSPRKNLPPRNTPDSFCRLLHPTKSSLRCVGGIFLYGHLSGRRPLHLACARPLCRLKAPLGLSLLRNRGILLSEETKNPNPSPIEKRFGFSLFGAMEGTRTPGLLIRSARRAIPSIFGSYVLTLFLCDVSQVLNFEFLHPLSDFATICTLCTF